MTFYLKYRSQKLDELDLKDVRELLKKIVKSGKIPHAFLFSGPKGTGKTSAARILAKVVNCENRRKNSVEPCNKCDHCKSITKGGNIDVIELDAASHRGIDDVRALRDAVKLSPAHAAKKVYIIDEAHMLTAEASNALLKTLEEPPDHVMFILATTNPEKLIETIKSRATNIKFNKANNEEIIRSLSRVVAGEKIKADKRILEAIAKSAGGSFRDAIKVLEQLTVENKKLKLEEVEKKLFQGGFGETEKFVSLLIERNAKDALIHIEKLVGEGGSIKVFLEQLIPIFREALLAEVGLDGEKINGLNKFKLIQLIELFSKAASDLPAAVLEQIPVEIAVIKWCEDGKNNTGRSSRGGSEVGPGSNNKPETTRARKTQSSESGSTKKVSVIASMVEDEMIVTVENSEPNERLNEINDGVWKNILTNIRSKNASTEALLRAAKPIDFDGSTLKLGVFYRFHKERLEEHQHKITVEATIEEIVGTPVRIVCALTQPPAKPELKEVVKDFEKGRGSFDQSGVGIKETNADPALTDGGSDDIVKIAKEIFS